jgi:predicted secreted Zn-dependent protease
MGRHIKAVFLFIVFASTAVAGEKRIDVASIDKNRPSYWDARNTTRPVVVEKYEYYDIKGRCEKDLRCEMSQKGCRWDDGRRYDSVTRWSWQWEYGHDQACTPDAVTVTLEIIFHYPKWVQTADAPQPLVNKWNDYLKSLMVHENGHRNMAVEAATEFERAVAKLPSVQSCSEFDRMVQALSREWMEKLGADSKEYDLATSHGIKQGALFP